MEYSNTDMQVVKFKGSLHNLKDQAHTYFDKIWKLRYISREEAYLHLARWMGVEEPMAHMAKMDSDKCKEVITWAVMMLNDLRRLDLDFGDNPKHPYYELITHTNKQH